MKKQPAKGRSFLECSQRQTTVTVVKAPKWNLVASQADLKFRLNEPKGKLHLPVDLRPKVIAVHLCVLYIFKLDFPLILENKITSHNSISY